MIVTPPTIAILSFLKRRQTCSQYPRALISISPSSTPDSSAIAPAMPALAPRISFWAPFATRAEITRSPAVQ